jgi:PAS domain-containing protein
VTAAIRDISARKDAEKAFGADGRQVPRAAGSGSGCDGGGEPVGGEIVLLNVQAEKQFGYRRDELVGQK